MSARSTASALLGYERGITACKQRHAVSARPCAQMLLSPAGRPSRAGRTGDANWGAPQFCCSCDSRSSGPSASSRSRSSTTPLGRSARRGAHRGRDRRRRDDAANSGCHLRPGDMAGYPGFLAGAGTLLNPAQVARVAGAGARFAVSPGFDPRVVDACQASDVANLAMVSSPSSSLVAMVRKRSTSRSTTTAYSPSLPPKCS
jgi:hypothetical protein